MFGLQFNFSLSTSLQNFKAGNRQLEGQSSSDNRYDFKELGPLSLTDIVCILYSMLCNCLSPINYSREQIDWYLSFHKRLEYFFYDSTYIYLLLAFARYFVPVE